MKLKEWDWNAQTFAEVEYPDAPVKAFVDWMRNSKQWREDPERVFHRFLKFEAELQDAKAEQDTAERCTASTQAGEPCKGKPVKDGLCMAHLKAAKAA